jgi:acyl carrier protein
MSPEITSLEMKRFIIDTLELDDLQPEDIDDDEPLLAQGLGLDSIDGLELDIALRKKYPIEGVEGKPTQGSQLLTVRSLVEFLSTRVRP